MSSDLNARLKALPSLVRAALNSEWLRLFGKPKPPKLRKELAVRILAYRLQEKELGGLSRKAEQRLAQLGRELAENPRKPLVGEPVIKPGTKLIRSWQGTVHQVFVGERGYEYKGRSYRSLSEIARLITGTRWNGPLFFGLRNGRRESEDVS